MTGSGRNRTWTWLRLLAVVYVVGWVVNLGIGYTVPDGTNTTFQEAPLLVSAMVLSGLAVSGSIPVGAYLVWKDRGELDRAAAEVTKRRLPTTLALQVVTSGLYALHYVSKRRSVDTSRVESLQRYRARLDEARSLLDEGAQAAGAGEYDRALDSAEAARDRLRQADDAAKVLDVDTGRRDRLGEELRNRRAEWGIQRARATLDRADGLAEEGAYEEAVELAATAADQTPTFPGGQPDRELLDRTSAVEQEARRRRLEWTVDLAEASLADGERQAEAGDYEAATDAATEAAGRLRDVIDDVGGPGLDTTGAESALDEARRRQVEWTTARLRERLSEAGDAAADGRYERATETARDVRSAAESASEDLAGTGVDTDPLEAVAADALQFRFDAACDHLEARLETARTEAEDGNYRRALEGAEGVESDAGSLRQRFQGSVEGIDDLERIRERAGQRRSEWERQALVERINDAKATADDDPERARETLQSVLSTLEAANTLSDREQSLLEEEAREAYLGVLTRELETGVDRGTDLLADGEYDRALDVLGGVLSDVEDGLESADRWGVTDTDDLEAVAARVESRFVEANVERVESRIESGIDAFEAGDHERARDIFDAAAEAAATAAEQLPESERTDPTDERARLDRLAEVARANSDIAGRVALGIEDETADLRGPDAVAVTDSTPEPTAATAAGEAGPPAAVPVGPDLDVEYLDISVGDRIGRGGSADVLDATVEVDGQVHRGALKRPRGERTITGTDARQFVEEAQTWARLDDHDFVVGVLDWGDTPMPWILMEYMDGGDLGEYVGALPFDRAVWTARCVTEGVAHAHSRGVAHLDLKPGNVLFRSTDGGWPVPKVGDWGLARTLLDADDDVDGLTPQYAAPEQVDPDRFGDPDQSTDIYQLGAVFYELFVGHPPFADAADLTRAIVEDAIAPPSEANPDLPPALDDVLLRALAREKADRYESVLYLRDALADLGTATERPST